MTEKPMVIDEKQCQAVLDAEKRNNRKIIVTFNYRYAPKHRTVKEVLMAARSGACCRSTSTWYLDVYHGADYFRRWHRAAPRRRQPLRAQGDAPFRSRQLVARRRSRRSHRPTGSSSLRIERAVPPHELPSVPAQEEVPVLLRHYANAKRMKLYAAPRTSTGTTATAACIATDVDIFDTMSAS